MNYSKTFSVIIVFISLVLTFLYSSFGLDWVDSFYYMNFIRDESYVSQPMVSGTIFLYHQFLVLVGNHFVILWRNFQWLLLMSSIFVPYMALLNSKEKYNSIYFLVFAIFCMSNKFRIDPYCLTYLLFSLCLTSFFIYQKRPRTFLIITISFIIAVATSVRFPNIILYPFTLFAVFLSNYKNNNMLKSKKIRDFIVLFVCTLLFFVLCVSMTNKDIFTYFHDIENSINGVGELHSFKSLIYGYLVNTKIVLFYLALFVFFYVSYRCNKNKRIISDGIFYLILTICYLSIFLFVVIGKHDALSFSYHFRSILMASIIFVMLLSIYLKSFNFYSIFNGCIIVSFSLIPALGSDTRLFHMLPVLVCFLPIIIAKSRIQENEQYNTFIKVTFAILFIAVIGRRLWSPQLYPGTNQVRCSLVNVDYRLKYLYSSKQDEKKMSEIMACYNKEKNKHKVIFWGTQSHVFTYLTSATRISDIFRLEPESVNAFDKFKIFIEQKHPAVIYVPNSESGKNNSMEYYMKHQNYKVFHHNGYCCFEPIN
jgi:hypothetical protein